MDDLRLTFLIFGVVAIVAILVHGLWTIRKNANSKRRPNGFRTKPSGTHIGRTDNTDGKSSAGIMPSRSANTEFDEHGVGSVRVLSGVNPIPPIKIDTNPSVDLRSNIKVVNAKEDQDVDDVDLSEPRPVRLDIVQDDSAIARTSAEIEMPKEGKVKLIDDSELDDLSLANSSMDFGSVATPRQPQDEPHISNNNKQSQLYGSVVTQPKPEFLRQKTKLEPALGIPSPPASLLKRQAELNQLSSDLKEVIEPHADNHNLTRPELELVSQAMTNGADSNKPKSDKPTPSFAEKEDEPEPEPKGFAAHARRLVSRRRKSVAERIRKEPKLASDAKPTEDQMRIDFDESPKASTASKEPQKASSQQQEVLVLHVKAADDMPIQGASLLPMLLTLGFKFGEQDIFHRHVNTNGKGQVLFSLANMFKPGHFDIDAMETFTTRGLALFMMLPIDGDPQQVFNMMHNATRKLAEEFNCEILDEKRQPLSKLALQKCSEKIREFERGKQ